MKKIIFFDLDGTIVDTRRDIIDSVNHMLKVMGAETLGDAEIQEYVGQGLKHLIQSSLKTEDEKRIERGSEIYRKQYQSHMLDQTKLYRGAFDLLDYLKTRILYILTNKPDPFSTDILKSLGVSSFFTGVIAGNSPYPKKPDPKAVKETIVLHNLTPDKALLIGDSLIDMQTAQNAGMEYVILTHGFSPREKLGEVPEELLVDSIPALLEMAKKKGW